LKKEAKTFARSGTRWASSARLKGPKFFGSFFQKRTACLNPWPSILSKRNIHPTA
jgi:hypothetical protein